MAWQLPMFRKATAPRDDLVSYEARVFDERRGTFARLRNARVLIYWPHGFGDFVHLGYVLPLLEPSNRYWITRYGDDFSMLYRNADRCPAITSGVRETANDFGSSARDFHLGIRANAINGKEQTLAIHPVLAQGMRRHEIDAVLWTDYPDYRSMSMFPYHSKARSLLRSLVSPERLAAYDLTQRLTHTLPFTADQPVAAFVEQRLRAVFGKRDFSRLCIVLSGGHTGLRKNWDAAHVHRFVQAYLADAPERRAVVLLNEMPSTDAIDGGVTTWNALFADCPYAYAELITALLRRASLVVGVPAGPLHLALAMNTVPTLALWRAHHPCAYEEPNAMALHAVTKAVAEGRRPEFCISTSVPPSFAGPTTQIDDEFSGARVYELASGLLERVSGNG